MDKPSLISSIFSFNSLKELGLSRQSCPAIKVPEANLAVVEDPVVPKLVLAATVPPLGR